MFSAMKQEHQIKIFMKQNLNFMEDIIFLTGKKSFISTTSLDNILSYFFLSWKERSSDFNSHILPKSALSYTWYKSVGNTLTVEAKCE